VAQRSPAVLGRQGGGPLHIRHLDNSMRIATYVSGINARLANLLEWLEETTPDIACFRS
jgi:hypothetical protein